MLGAFVRALKRPIFVHKMLAEELGRYPPPIVDRCPMYTSLQKPLLLADLCRQRGEYRQPEARRDSRFPPWWTSTCIPRSMQKPAIAGAW